MNEKSFLNMNSTAHYVIIEEDDRYVSSSLFEIKQLSIFFIDNVRSYSYEKL